MTFGNYPESMRRIVGKRLPKFTEGESKLVKGSFDFLAVNYYTTNYADAAPPPNAFQLSYTADRQVNLTSTYPSLSLPLLLLLALYIYIYIYELMLTTCFILLLQLKEMEFLSAHRYIDVYAYLTLFFSIYS